MRYGDNPVPDLPQELGQKIMHAELHFGDNKIYLSDAYDNTKLAMGNNFTVHIDCDSEEEIRHIFEQMADGAVIVTPLEDTFWGAIFGSLTDRFGIQWTFNFQKPE